MFLLLGFFSISIVRQKARTKRHDVNSESEKNKSNSNGTLSGMMPRPVQLPRQSLPPHIIVIITPASSCINAVNVQNRDKKRKVAGIDSLYGLNSPYNEKLLTLGLIVYTLSILKSAILG